MEYLTQLAIVLGSNAFSFLSARGFFLHLPDEDLSLGIGPFLVDKTNDSGPRRPRNCYC